MTFDPTLRLASEGVSSSTNVIYFFFIIIIFYFDYCFFFFLPVQSFERRVHPIPHNYTTTHHIHDRQYFQEVPTQNSGWVLPHLQPSNILSKLDLRGLTHLSAAPFHKHISVFVCVCVYLLVQWRRLV